MSKKVFLAKVSDNQDPDNLDQIIYNLDSRMCKAEQLWNVTAESGKKTLVWHWPGSSWPPSSDSENLYVVDGTQPASVNSIVNIDKEFLFSDDIGAVCSGIKNTFLQKINQI